MRKLSYVVDSEWVEHSFEPVFQRSRTTGGERLNVGVHGDGARLFECLVLQMEAPFFLLYVLHTPRGEADPGWYQSPVLEAEQVRGCIERYGSYFSADARLDLWAHSPSAKGTVVRDRHGVICARGPLDGFEALLSGLGHRPGAVVVPDPHQHHYREECNVLATALVRNQAWMHSPLTPEDEQ